MRPKNRAEKRWIRFIENEQEAKCKTGKIDKYVKEKLNRTTRRNEKKIIKELLAEYEEDLNEYS